MLPKTFNLTQLCGQAVKQYLAATSARQEMAAELEPALSHIAQTFSALMGDKNGNAIVHGLPLRQLDHKLVSELLRIKHGEATYESSHEQSIYLENKLATCRLSLSVYISSHFNPDDRTAVLELGCTLVRLSDRGDPQRGVTKASTLTIRHQVAAKNNLHIKEEIEVSLVIREEMDEPPSSINSPSFGVRFTRPFPYSDYALRYRGYAANSSVTHGARATVTPFEISSQDCWARILEGAAGIMRA